MNKRKYSITEKDALIRTPKSEAYYPRSFANLDQLISEVSAYIGEYNAIRPHGFNGGMPPNKAETGSLIQWRKLKRQRKSRGSSRQNLFNASQSATQ